jgi:hypothetical protein
MLTPSERGSTPAKGDSSGFSTAAVARSEPRSTGSTHCSQPTNTITPCAGCSKCECFWHARCWVSVQSRGLPMAYRHLSTGIHQQPC